MSKIIKVYAKLFKKYGPQGWWPIVNDKALLCEYHVNAPKNEEEALEICFGAILTQNTSWKNVEKAIINLNKNNLIDASKILKIKNRELALIIRSSGYYNQKAKKLKNFCHFLFENYNGSLELLFKNNVNELRKQLLSVNGIGPETADSIILYAAKKPVFVVDAYTKRIFSRVGYKENTYDGFRKLFMQGIPNSEKLFNECHALLVELGKNICRKRPLCGMCPVNMHCAYGRMAIQKRGIA